MKPALTIIAVVAVAFAAYAEVNQYTVNLTVSTNATATQTARVGTRGDLARLVATLPAGLTSVVVVATDIDGTALYSGTWTGATMSTTYTTNVLHGAFNILTSNALRTTNTASLAVPVIITENR